MRQRIIKRIFALSMVGAMTFALVACATTSSQDEPSESQPTQEVETTPTPTPSEAPTPSQDTTPNEDEPSKADQGQEAEQSSATPTQEPPEQEPTPTPSEDTTTKEPQEPITTQEPTPSQGTTQTPTPTPTTTTTPTTPTTPPTSTPIHTHNFKGGDCSTPSICECGEIGSYGDHIWTTQVNEHYEEVQVGTKIVNDYAQVTIYGCNSCNFTSYNYDDIIKHTDPRFEESKRANGGHMGSSTWSKTTTEVVGTHEEPEYATRYTSELVSVCSICGKQQ